MYEFALIDYWVYNTETNKSPKCFNILKFYEHDIADATGRSIIELPSDPNAEIVIGKVNLEGLNVLLNHSDYGESAFLWYEEVTE